MVNEIESLAVDAAKKGDIDKVRSLMLDGANNLDQLALASAISVTNTNILLSNIINSGIKESYINASAALLAENGNDRCLLFSKNHLHTALYACKTDQIDILKSLINKGIDIKDINQIYFEAKKYEAIKILDFLKDNYEEPLDVKIYDFGLINDEI